MPSTGQFLPVTNRRQRVRENNQLLNPNDASKNRGKNETKINIKDTTK